MLRFVAELSGVEKVLEMVEMCVVNLVELEPVGDFDRRRDAGVAGLTPDNRRNGFENLTAKKTHAELAAVARSQDRIGHDAGADLGKIAHDAIGHGHVVFEEGDGNGSGRDGATRLSAHEIVVVHLAQGALPFGTLAKTKRAAQPSNS